jgi:hypothetical protein
MLTIGMTATTFDNLQRQQHQELLSAIAAQGAEIAALRAELLALREERAPRGRPTDLALLTRAAPLIFARAGRGPWESRELVSWAEEDEELHLLLASRLTPPSSAARRIGILLAAHADCPLGDYVLRVCSKQSPLLFCLELGFKPTANP